MRVPLSWLREFVPIERTADDLAARLSATGLTVDGVERPARELSGIIVGEVRAKRPHPDADKLMLVSVFDGTAERPIVCGANNYEVGSLVPLATPGARLPGGFEIAARKVRGELSEGMLCSSKELGLGADHAGIMLLDGLTPGEDLVAALELDDEILVIDVLPNRPDALSILGVAREIAAIDGLPLSCPPLPAAPAGGATDVVVSVTDPDGCPRYTARVISGVAGGGRSPWWLRRRLIYAGMRPIDPIVDATNHTMLELGQPLHAFDLATIPSGRIDVRAAAAGERMTTLDGQDRELVAGDLLITDGTRPIALAGVMGGAETEVTEATTTILLESATFAAPRISATARRLDLRSEAAQRFERGVDPRIVDDASERCAALIAMLTGGTVATGIAEAGPGAPPPAAIGTSLPRIAARLGVELEQATVVGHLSSIGCAVEVADSAFTVTPPTWRPDIQIPEDLDEEIARLVGYDSIPSSLPAISRIGGLTAGQQRLRRIRHLLLDRGCDEAVTLSLIAPGFADRLGLATDDPWRNSLRLANPLSEEESVLRPSLLPGLLEAARRNASRRVSPILLFEIGTRFVWDGTTLEEEPTLAVVLHGPAERGLHGPARPLDAYDIRDLTGAIAVALGLDHAIDAAVLGPMFHPGRSATVTIAGQIVGSLGELMPRVAEELELPGRVAVAELSLASLLTAGHAPQAPLVGRFPSIDRDLAIVTPDTVPASEILGLVRDAGGALVDAVAPFDRYEGPQIGEGNASLAVEIRLRSDERTLADEDAVATMTAIEAAIAARGWAIRS